MMETPEPHRHCPDCGYDEDSHQSSGFEDERGTQLQYVEVLGRKVMCLPRKP
jgi:hypothetical protein